MHHMTKANSTISVLAHTIAYISHGLPLAEIGPIPEQFYQKMLLKTCTDSTPNQTAIIHIDNFENVIINVKTCNLNH